MIKKQNDGKKQPKAFLRFLILEKFMHQNRNKGKFYERTEGFRSV